MTDQATTTDAINSMNETELMVGLALLLSLADRIRQRLVDLEAQAMAGTTDHQEAHTAE